MGEVRENDPHQKSAAIKARTKLSHYYCEAAEDKESAGDLKAARELAERALDWTKESVWPHTILARLDQQQNQHSPMRLYLHQIQIHQLLTQLY